MRGENKKIVCATIGSESCKRAEDKAIALAQKDGKLIFLYVVDSTFLGSVSREIHGTQTLSKGLHNIGEIILGNAKKKAEDKGIIAETAIMEGTAREEIEKAIAEVGADLLVIGSEKRGWINEHLIKGAVSDFVEELREKTGAEVVVVE
ncbi:MAG: universal stress protein [Candidatus Altiarchaeota archaeon]|nr:universal stress protein [Candidatus Altiarchaeota archaeon]